MSGEDAAKWLGEHKARIVDAYRQANSYIHPLSLSGLNPVCDSLLEVLAFICAAEPVVDNQFKAHAVEERHRVEARELIDAVDNLIGDDQSKSSPDGFIFKPGSGYSSSGYGNISKRIF